MKEAEFLDYLFHRLAGVTDAAVECLVTIQLSAGIWRAPHRLYGAKVSWDGERWRALLGDAESGVAGFGRTPWHACESFDQLWRGWPEARGPQVRGAN